MPPRIRICRRCAIRWRDYLCARNEELSFRTAHSPKTQTPCSLARFSSTIGIRMSCRVTMHLRIAALLIVVLFGASFDKKDGPINPRDVEVVHAHAALTDGTSASIYRLASPSIIFLRAVDDRREFIVPLSERGQVPAALGILSMRGAEGTLARVFPVDGIGQLAAAPLATGRGSIWLVENVPGALLQFAADTLVVQRKLSLGRDIPEFRSTDGLSTIGGLVVRATDFVFLEGVPESTGGVTGNSVRLVQVGDSGTHKYSYPIDGSIYGANTPTIIGFASVAPNEFLTIERGTLRNGKKAQFLQLIELPNQNTVEEVRKITLIDLNYLDFGSVEIAGLAVLDDHQTVVLTASSHTVGDTIPLYFVRLPGALVSPAWWGYVSVTLVILLGGTLLYFALAKRTDSDKVVAVT